MLVEKHGAFRRVRGGEKPEEKVRAQVGESRNQGQAGLGYVNHVCLRVFLCIKVSPKNVVPKTIQKKKKKKNKR